MSRPPVQEPTVTHEDDALCGETITHPAYGQIGAFRVSGHAVLYGSEFRHQHYVTIRIHTSEHKRSLSNDWHHSRRELVAVSMSEAQWAAFVSGMNVGDGPCCTLEHIAGERFPTLPEPKPSTEHFRKEIAEVFAEVKAQLAEVAGELTDAVGKRKAEDLRKRVLMAADRMVRSSGFVAEQFDEHVETTVEKARIEVNAFVEAAVNRAGLQALAGQPVISLPRTGEAE